MTSMEDAALVRMCKNATLDFVRQGACRGLDPGLFFPGREDAPEIDRAQAVCEECPVRVPCLAWAVRHEKFGVWGGKSEKARIRLRKRLHIGYSDPTIPAPQCGTPAGYQAHRRAHTAPCGLCTDAYRAYRTPTGPRESRADNWMTVPPQRNPRVTQLLEEPYD